MPLRSIRVLSVLGLVLLCAPGCAVMMATRQPDKKDLAVVVEGTPRTHLIAELGPPLWSDDRDGELTDVFAFKQGYRKMTKATRALAHGAADVFTGGLWEVVGIPAETLADGTNVKLEVQYDAARNVRSVKVIEGEKMMTERQWFGQRKKTALSKKVYLPQGGSESHATSVAKNVLGLPGEQPAKYVDYTDEESE